MPSIKQINKSLKNKEFSCRELTQKYLEKIEKSNLNAYVKVCGEEALKIADKVDKKISSGKEISLIEGVPMTLKDLLSTKGIETTCCSKILKGYIPTFDATVWELLEAENAIMLGKTNMDEFAMGSSGETSCFGGARNPHNEKCSPGGSSSGGASAVGGDLAVYALGTDTGGSIRQPASFCGVSGLKPTYGAVSRYGAVALASSYDQIGPIAKSAEDLSIVFDTIAKHDPKDSTSNKDVKFDTYSHLNDSIKGMKIGIPKECFDGVNAEVKKGIEDALKVYESLGVYVEECSLPELKFALPVYYILMCAEATSNLARFDGVRYGYRTENYKDINEMICKTRSEGFGDEVRRRIMLGNYVLSASYYDAYYRKAQVLRGRIANAFKNIFKKFDVLVTPTSPTTAFEFGHEFTTPVEMYLADVLTVPINTAGIPALSIPCGFDSENLPIGMQIMGSMFSEAKILNVAHQYQLITNN